MLPSDEARARCTGEMLLELLRLKRRGLTFDHCLKFFGEDWRGNPLIEEARRICDRGSGDIHFDNDPLVSEFADGAYVSAWVWVDDCDGALRRSVVVPERWQLLSTA
ncbi:hypothetical protein AYM40_29155 [Paraburkholderia phytofirmans OLGA172]|uniref:Uncharacterized protein n=2 Tax=Paraburkholderia phytofirmans TaxID=261302 RepID=A0A167WF47_9BURK|nr:hypothetical protein AYM40_29155 [Paraburkholderia phytofirmans OLGA172]